MFNHLSEPINTNTLLVSFDAVNFYSNIPNRQEIEAIQSWLDNYSNKLSHLNKKAVRNRKDKIHLGE